MRGLEPTLKAARTANYIATLRSELLRLARTCGQPHPALVPLERLEILDGRFQSQSAAKVFGYEPDWGLPSLADQQALREFLGQTPHWPAERHLHACELVG